MCYTRKEERSVSSTDRFKIRVFDACEAYNISIYCCRWPTLHVHDNYEFSPSVSDPAIHCQPLINGLQKAKLLIRRFRLNARFKYINRGREKKCHLQSITLLRRKERNMKWVVLVAKVTPTKQNHTSKPTSLPIMPMPAIDGVPMDILRK